VKAGSKRLSYVLITPARNEEAHIEKTIQAVISQTILPEKWVIVSDGSTDRTDDIVKKYLSSHRWFELVRMPEHKDRDWANKAHCFNAGYQKVKDLEYDIIANLDADISSEDNLFEFLLEKFIRFPDLGVAGVPMIEADYDPVKDGIFNETDVFGACQLFRRECFEEIGGYTPIKWGGIDWVALRTARMNGWKTQSFMEMSFFHHRPMGATESNLWAARINYGKKDYYLGNHPLWEAYRIIYQMTRKPYFLNGLLLFFGYSWACLSRMERPVSRELMNFHRGEQMQRLKSVFKNFIRYGNFNGRGIQNGC
jgi:glycosyltransferase involved in cell wall biosynthesis